jgi:beta-glucosidase-like glycosyl hydrolase
MGPEAGADWDDVGRMVWEQRVCADYVEASAMAVRAGNDLVMTTPQFFDGAQDAVARGLLADSRRVVEPGEFELLVGPSSRPADLLRAAFRIEG